MAIGTQAATKSVPAKPKPVPNKQPAKAAASAAPSASGVNFVSLNPDTATQGGLIDDIDVEITDALAVMWDYNGNAPMGPALAVEYTDVNGTQHIQYYSAGKAEDWTAHESGEGFIAASGKTGFSSSANIMMLFDSMVKAGFPKEYLTGNVKVIVGMKCHVLQQVTERKGLIRTGKNADRPPSVLLVSKIHRLPDGVGVGGGQQATAPAATTTHGANGAATGGGNAAAAAPASGGDLDAEIQGYLLEALAESPVIEKKEIVKIVFAKSNQAGKTAAERNKAVIRAGQQDFLKGLEAAGISYTGTEISISQ